jgi:hypothetical protein
VTATIDSQSDNKSHNDNNSHSDNNSDNFGAQYLSPVPPQFVRSSLARVQVRIALLIGYSVSKEVERSRIHLGIEEGKGRG